NRDCAGGINNLCVVHHKCSALAICLDIEQAISIESEPRLFSASRGKEARSSSHARYAYSARWPVFCKITTKIKHFPFISKQPREIICERNALNFINSQRSTDSSQTHCDARN